MINYSIIIPHKNIPDLLQRCLDSIPIRDDLETIIVDDNSDSSIVNFDNFPGKNRPNTEIILSKRKGGAGHARNLGLKHARGKWILFADADDYYEKGLSAFLDSNINANKDCIYFSVSSVNSNTMEKANRDFLYDDYIKKYNPNIPHSEDWILYNKWEPWNKMISHDFLLKEKIIFDETSKCNDMTFSLLVSLYASKIKICKDHLYCVTYSEQSMTQSISSLRELHDCLTAFKKKNCLNIALKHLEWIVPNNVQYSFFRERVSSIKYAMMVIYHLLTLIPSELGIYTFKRQIREKISTENGKTIDFSNPRKI